jgi:nitroreductase
LNLSDAIEERRSIRAFKEEPVEAKVIEEVLGMVIHAPSALNLQPWEFTVVMNEERKRLSRRLLKAYKEKRIGCGPGTAKSLPEQFNRRMEKTSQIMRPKIKAVSAALEFH